MDRLCLFLIKSLYGKEVNEMLAMIYATLILKGKKTLENVPEKLKPQVQEILEAME